MLDRYVLVGRNRHQLLLLVHGERAIILNYADVPIINSNSAKSSDGI